MDTRLKGLILAPVLLLAACNNAAPTQQAAPVATATATGAAPESPAMARVSAEVPAEVIVSTNEPFQSAVVKDGAILLKTPEHPDGKPYAVTAVAASRTADSAKRSWSGTGAEGEVQVEARSGACLDSMSGAQFPLSGAITVRGERTEGCGRPAGTPPPPEPQEG